MFNPSEYNIFNQIFIVNYPYLPNYNVDALRS